MKNLFEKAHEMAREIKSEYPEVDYRTQFGICLSYLLNNKEEAEMTIRRLVEKVTEQYKKVTARRDDAYTSIAKAEVENMDLPELTGSTKQISWAENIRARVLTAAVDNVCRKEIKGTYGIKKTTNNTAKAIELTKEKQIKKIEEVAVITDSKWWIEGREELMRPSSYTMEETEYTVIYQLDSYARYKQKELTRLETAKETGVAQVIVRLPQDGVVWKITPKGEIVKEEI